MLLCDVNIIVHAQRAETERDRAVRSWLNQTLLGHEAVALAPVVLAAVVRVLTNPRIFATPTTPSDALAFIDAMHAAPAALAITPGPRHWQIFTDMVREQRLRGDAVPDAYIAAIALEQGATVVTADRGFARFGVRTLDPTA